MVLKVPLGKPVRSRVCMIPHSACSYLNHEKVESSLHEEYEVSFLQRRQYGKKRKSLWRNLTIKSQPWGHGQHRCSTTIHTPP